jgi:hypothetical protein
VSENEPTKACPLCAETIKSAAKICPFCRTRQSRFVLLQDEIAGAVVALMWIAIIAAICEWVFPEERAVNSRNFAYHKNDLAVVRTSWEDRPKSSDFFLTGFVTNRGAHPWRVRELEVRFLDDKSNLLDVRRRDVSEPFVVQSHQEHAFRIGLSNLAFTNSGVNRQVRVQMAFDGDRPAKPD